MQRLITALVGAALLVTVFGQKKPTPVGLPKAQPTPSPTARTDNSNRSSDNKTKGDKQKDTKTSSNKEEAAKQISVTSNDLARLPVGKSYVADTRKGATYDFDASSSPLDFKRIKLNTDNGEISLHDLLQKLRVIDGGGGGCHVIDGGSGGPGCHLRVGAPKDLRRKSVSSTPRGENFTCDGIRCDCSGDDDCNNMFGSSVCGSIAVCRDDGTCSCLRIGEKYK